jgi:hypothetical protein
MSGTNNEKSPVAKRRQRGYGQNFLFGCRSDVGFYIGGSLGAGIPIPKTNKDWSVNL